LPKENQPHKEQIKVTDKRIFTADGDIREEFRKEIKPAEPIAKPAEAPPARPQEAKPQPPKQTESHPGNQERRKTLGDKATNPGTPFTNFLEQLIAQGYMSLGMLPNPYQAQARVDVAAARQMIDILSLLHEKTANNLTPDEEDFLTTHLGELKLAYVKRTKSI
jgi:hypothetical protein